ncbi:MAG: Cj0069 family protein [Rhizomicrobium sp.]
MLPMVAPDLLKVGIVWRGEFEPDGSKLPENSRLRPVAEALEGRGLAVESIAYCESASQAVREKLLSCDGALVWVDPLTDGKDRHDLDAILRDVAAQGLWISAHPDVIAKIGTKEILWTTRQLGWGTETFLYRSFDVFAHEFPSCLLRCGSRVVKRQRGNGGQGVWKVTLAGQMESREAIGMDSLVDLQQATHRDGTTSQMKLEEFIGQYRDHFSTQGVLIDQAFQPRISEGMVRCYMSGTELIGFARQYPKGYSAGIRDENTFGLPAEKTMLAAAHPQFQSLRHNLEQEWTPQMLRILALDPQNLPALWDADFLFGPKLPNGEDTFVLCEINASCITPFPPSAPERIADHVVRAVRPKTDGRA